jgi:hypothetical protein
MSSIVIRNILRAIGLLLFQVLILSRADMSIGDFTFIHIIIYPFWVLLLPLNTPKAGVLLIAFASGIFVDFFYNSPGVHAAAMVLTAYLRGVVLRVLEPYEGYSNSTSPTLMQMGFGWFLSYTTIMFFIFALAFYSFEAFTFVYFFQIFMKTIFTIIPSVILFVILHSLFRSKV